jgi:hypothetical protein
MFGKSTALLAALSLAASPALAQPSAQPLSLQPAFARAGASMQGTNRFSHDAVVPIVMLVLIVGGILLATHVINKDHHAQTHSP